KDGSIYLIDVREKSEWDAGHIPGAHFLPLSSFDPKKIPAAKEGQRIVVYCRSGNRSGRAIGIAQASGRTDVKANFSGSMNAWLQAGEPVAR
ncbi:MAG: rhodanese-like domain-containing protein, partial [Hyphomicrobiales bacterium]|nr:rhodanese-like domain-containing protein [Hyphomicrobiales bacterium]